MSRNLLFHDRKIIVFTKDFFRSTINSTLFVTKKFTDGISEVNCYKWSTKSSLHVQVTVE